MSKLTVYGDDMGRRHLSDLSVFVIFLREREVTKNLAGCSKANAFIRLMPS